VLQLFIDFKKANESVRREVMCSILIEFDILMKMLGLIKMCLNETHSRVRIQKHLSDMFLIKNVLKKNVLLPLLFHFASEYAIRRVQVKQNGLKLNGTHQHLVYVDDVNILGGRKHTIEKKTEALVFASKETGLEANANKTKYMVMSQDQNAGRSHNIKIDNSSFEMVEEFNYLRTT